MNQNQRLVSAFLNPILISIIVFWIIMRPINRSSFTRGNIFLFIVLVIGIYIWENIQKWSELTKKYIRSIVWITVITLIGLTFYVNHYMPHGEYYPTGNHDDETGREIYREDMIDLKIPEWAKFLRANATGILIIGILVAGSISDRTKALNNKGGENGYC